MLINALNEDWNILYVAKNSFPLQSFNVSLLDCQSVVALKRFCLKFFVQTLYIFYFISVTDSYAPFFFVLYLLFKLLLEFYAYIECISFKFMPKTIFTWPAVIKSFHLDFQHSCCSWWLFAVFRRFG